MYSSETISLTALNESALVMTIKVDTDAKAIFEEFTSFAKEAAPELIQAFSYDPITDTLDVGKWDVVVLDGVNVRSIIVGDDPGNEDETTMTTEQTPSAAQETSAIERTPLTTEIVPELSHPAIQTVQSTAVVESIIPVQTEIKTDTGAIVNQNAAPKAAQPQKPPKQKQPQPQKQPQAAKKPADKSALTELLANGIGSRAKPVEQSRYKPTAEPKQNHQLPNVRNNPAALDYMQNAIQDFVVEGQDGVDFINISLKAKTPLGRILDIDANLPFVYPTLGTFTSVGGLWMFITDESPNDEYRYVHGQDARRTRYMIRNSRRHVQGERIVVADATWVKVNASKELKEDLINCDLPFKSFQPSSQSAIPQHSPIAHWYIPVLDRIVDTLREIVRTGDKDLVPDFSFLDNKNKQYQRGRHR